MMDQGMTVVVTAEIHWFELSETQRRGQLSINTFKNHIYIYMYNCTCTISYS